MRDHTLLPDFFDAPLLYQPHDSVECAAHLERSDALKVLAFEKEPDFWLRGFLSLPLCTPQRVCSLWRRRKIGERSICQHWSAMDVGFDERVGSFDGSARQGEVWGASGGGFARHCGTMERELR